VPARDVHRSQVTLTTVFTVCAGVLMVGLAVWFVVHTLVALTLTISALMIAVSLDHVVAFIQRRGVSRVLSIGLVTLLSLGLLVGLGFTVIPPAVSQAKQLIHHVPTLIAQAQHSRVFQFLNNQLDLVEKIEASKDEILHVVTGAAAPLLMVVGGVMSAVGAVVTVVFLSIFMLIFGGRLVQALLAEALPERRERYAKIMERVYDLIGGYLGGLILICSINATLTITFLAIIGVPFFLPLGLLSGFSSLVPYAGPFVAGTTVSILAFASTGTLWKGLASVLYFIIYGQIEGNILGPLVFRRTVHVNPLIVLLSVLFFGELAGVVGAVLAVPVTASLQILMRELLRERRERLKLAKTGLNTPG
jgi:predicted PurR-regulated permease PerM